MAFAAHVPTAVELYTPVGVYHQEPSAGVLDRVTCPSSAKCDEKIGSDVFGVSDVAVARVGAVSKLEHERRAYEVLSLVAGGFRTLKAKLVVPTGAKFDAPHLLIDRHTPLSRYASQVTDDSVWDLAALLDRMHRSGVAHGHINAESVGVVQEASGPWFWRTKGPQHLVFGSPQHLVVSPLAESELQLGSDIDGAGFSPLGPQVLERRVVAALREAVKDDPRGLRVRIKHEGALAGLSTSGARRATERVVAQHNAAVDMMEADIRDLLALFRSKLSSPRSEAGAATAATARVWASLVPEAGAVSVGKTTKETASQSATRKEIEAELDAAEGLLDARGHLALLQEIDAIRVAVYSPREVPDGLWPRTRNVANAAKAASASRREQDGEAEKAAARRLDALITELLASDKDVGEYRELLRIARDPSAKKSVVDEWHARLSEIRRAGISLGGLRTLHNEIRRWIRWSAKSEIREQRRNIRVHFESGVTVGEFLVVHFNKTSAYSGEQQAKIRAMCADAAKELDKLHPSITRPLKTGEWKPIDVFVSRQLPYGGRGSCLGLAHKIGYVDPDHPYKAGSIQVRAAEAMRDVPDTVLHELIHALHFRNEHARGDEGAYKGAMAGLQDLLEKYERAMDGSARWFDEYAAKNIYEFLVGVVQVLVGANAELRMLTEFVARNGEIKSHVLVILNAKSEMNAL